MHACASCCGKKRLVHVHNIRPSVCVCVSVCLCVCVCASLCLYMSVSVCLFSSCGRVRACLRCAMACFRFNCRAFQGGRRRGSACVLRQVDETLILSQEFATSSGDKPLGIDQGGGLKRRRRGRRRRRRRRRRSRRIGSQRQNSKRQGGQLRELPMRVGTQKMTVG